MNLTAKSANSQNAADELRLLGSLFSAFIIPYHPAPVNLSDAHRASSPGGAAPSDSGTLNTAASHAGAFPMLHLVREIPLSPLRTACGVLPDCLHFLYTQNFRSHAGDFSVGNGFAAPAESTMSKVRRNVSFVLNFPRLFLCRKTVPRFSARKRALPEELSGGMCRIAPAFHPKNLNSA